MGLKRCEGIVLRSLNLGESSKILTLYTREEGVVKVVAKGARKATSRIGGNVEPLYTIEAVYYAKEHRELHILSQASIVEAPRYILQDADRVMLGMACCEMIARLETAGASNPGVYGLLRATIKALNEPELEPRYLFFAFQLRLLELLGISPGIDRCYRCGSEAAEGAGYVFSEARLYCAQCLQNALTYKAMDAGVLNALRQFGHLPLSRVGALRFPGKVMADLYDFLTSFYRYHLEELGTLKAIEVLKQMKRLETEMRKS